MQEHHHTWHHHTDDLEDLERLGDDVVFDLSQGPGAQSKQHYFPRQVGNGVHAAKACRCPVQREDVALLLRLFREPFEGHGGCRYDDDGHHNVEEDVECAEEREGQEVCGCEGHHVIGYASVLVIWVRVGTIVSGVGFGL